MLTVEIIRADALTEDHKAAWLAMTGANAVFGSPLLHPAFFTEVARVRRDARLALYKDERGHIVAVLPFHQRGKGFARPIGAPFSDYTALITVPDFPLSGPEALNLAGIKHMPLNGLIDPYGLFSPINRSEDTGLQIDTRRPATPLNTRHTKKLRRREEKLHEALGPLRYVEDDLSPETFATLLGWKSAQTRRTGFSDFLSPKWVRQLMHNLFALDRAGFAHGQIISLYAGERLIAAKFGLRCGEHWHVWITSYDPDLSDYSPGLLFFRHLPDVLKRQGISICDLASGSVGHKELFANHFVPISNGKFHTGPGRTSISPSLTLPSWAQRLERRFDQIAALEPDPFPRLLSLAHALATAPRRLWRRPATAV